MQKNIQSMLIVVIVAGTLHAVGAMRKQVDNAKTFAQTGSISSQMSISEVNNTLEGPTWNQVCPSIRDPQQCNNHRLCTWGSGCEEGCSNRDGTSRAGCEQLSHCAWHASNPAPGIAPTYRCKPRCSRWLCHLYGLVTDTEQVAGDSVHECCRRGGGTGNGGSSGGSRGGYTCGVEGYPPCPTPPPTPAPDPFKNFKLRHGTYTIEQQSTKQALNAYTCCSFGAITGKNNNPKWSREDEFDWIIKRQEKLVGGWPQIYYTIQHKMNGRYLDAFENGNDYGVVTRGRQGNDSQNWLITPTGKPNEWTIQQKSNKRYLDAYEGTGPKHRYGAVTRKRQNNDSQKWILTFRSRDIEPCRGPSDPKCKYSTGKN